MISADNEVGRKLIKPLNFRNLKTTIDQCFGESDSIGVFHTRLACDLFSDISQVDKEAAKELLESIDLDRLIERIDGVEMMEEVGWWIVNIAEADMEIGLKILKSIKKSKEVKECMISSLIPKAENFRNKSPREILDVLTRQ